MRLEDALLYLVLDYRGWTPDRAEAVCRGAIAGGADVIHLAACPPSPDADEARQRIAHACREDIALLVVEDDAGLAQSLDATGVLLTDLATAGQVRTSLGNAFVVGHMSRTLNEARLAVSLNPDFLLHHGGAASASAFAALEGVRSLPLYAGGIRGLDEARELVESRVVRLCIESGILNTDNMKEDMAQYARLLGRSI